MEPYGGKGLTNKHLNKGATVTFFGTNPEKVQIEFYLKKKQKMQAVNWKRTARLAGCSWHLLSMMSC